MSDVFVSYKAEDRRRVQPLVEALQADGLSVWWDEQIAGGAAWRQSIEAELDRAKCVLVVWSKRSTGLKGSFVRDEATRAQRRGTYLPVRIDKVEPPLGFGETQAIPLLGWRGDRSDQRYQAVLEATRSIVDGKPLHEVTLPTFRAGLNRRAVMVGSAATAAVTVGVAGFLLRSGSAASNSIAILPFANLSGDPGQAYFSDGIAEELRTALSRIGGLKVVGRTSSEMVRDDDAKTAARKLDVANVLTGSVRRSQSTIRVSAQLVEGRNGVERWSNAYDRQAGDVLQIQSDIARRVAEALSLYLGRTDQNALADGRTGNPAAQDLYLRAIAIKQSGGSTEADFQQAIQLLAGATRLDPRFAEAYAEWSTTVLDLADLHPTSGSDYQTGSVQAEALARRAIAIAPNLASAHAALGAVLSFRLNIRGALSEFRRAAGLPGASPSMLINCSRLLAMVGRSAEALTMAERAIAADPLNPRAYSVKALVQFYARRYGEAIASARAALRLSPKRALTLAILGNSLLLLGRPAEAKLVFAQIPVDHFARVTGDALLAARTGERSAAHRGITRLQQLFGETAKYQEAQIHAQLSDVPQALAAFNTAISVREPALIAIPADPFLDPLRGDPRFEAIVRGMNFPA